MNNTLPADNQNSDWFEAYSHVLRNAITDRVRALILAATVLYILFNGLDWIIHPDHALSFLWIRAAVSICFMLGYGFSFLPAVKARISWLGDMIVLMGGVGICVMIYLVDGPQGNYHQGLNLVLLAIFIINSFQIGHNALTGLLVLFFYFVAVFAHGIGEYWPQVISALFFMGGTYCFVILLTRVYGKQHYREFVSTQKIKEAERAKSDFFANVSHELRTPLTLILSPLESLKSETQEKLSIQQKMLIETIYHNAVRLLQMVNGLLDFSKLEVGKVEVSREPIRVVELTRSIFEDFAPLMEQKQLKRVLDLPKKEIEILMDRYMYERILFNLLSNAVKFTPSKGMVSVKLRCRQNRLELVVTDTGIGIPKKDHGKLFQKFSQVESSSTRRFEGTGLGLAMVKQFAELLEGSVKVESQAGAGSSFWVDCKAPPAEKAFDDTEQSENEHDVKETVEAMRRKPQVHAIYPKNTKVSSSTALNKGNQPKIVLAEDNPDLAAYLSLLLQEFSEPTVVSNGQEAIDLIRKDPPDLVISDIMMPIKDGLELCRELKADSSLCKIPVVLLTALTDRNALLRGWEAGADEYLFKPFHPKEISMRIKALLRGLENLRKAENSERELQLAMKNALGGIAIFDREGRCQYMNRDYEHLLGVSFEANESDVKDWRAGIHAANLAQVEEAYEVMQKEGRVEIETLGVMQDGYQFQMQLVMVQKTEVGGEFAGHYAFIQDITERRYQEALEAKSELISTLSHEMRTPLQPLRAGISMVADEILGPVTEKQKEMLSDSLESLDRLVRLVNRILEFQKADACGLDLNLKKNDINQVLREVAKNMKHLLTYKKVSIELDLDDKVPCFNFDQDLMTEVLINFVDNAVKFTDEGVVLISSKLKDESVSISVKDSGIGISEEDLEKIFKPFGQTDAGKVQAPGRGTGLGLAIAKKVIKQHQGKVEVISSVGKGTTFTVTLPLEQSDENHLEEKE